MVFPFYKLCLELIVHQFILFILGLGARVANCKGGEQSKVHARHSRYHDPARPLAAAKCKDKD
jgi:hypothetical protein